jgi:hypothetical protein
MKSAHTSNVCSPVRHFETFGTEVAGRFVVNSKRVDETVRKIGVNWQHRKFGMVFHAKVIGNIPSASGLVAWYLG